MARPMAFRNFYPGDSREQIEGMLRGFRPREDIPEPCAAVAPHAGWRYSGAVAARALKTLAVSRPESLVLFSAVHRVRLAKAAVYPRGSWETPLGGVAVDEELAAGFVAGASELVEARPRAHDSEHALEVLMPLVHEIFPDVPVVPIMVPPDARPVDLGARLADIAGERPVAAVASTDFTHYGSSFGFSPAGSGGKAHEWMRGNDRRLIDRAVRMEAEEIVPEAHRHRNACGPGALAAAVAWSRKRGCGAGTLIERTDSHEVEHPEAPFETAVGYAGIAF